MTQGPGGRAPPAPPEPEAPTTFCALLPRMPQWKFAAPAGFLGRGPAAARAADPQPEPAGPAGVPALAAAVLGACEPRCAAPCPLSALSRCRAAGARGTRGARGTAGPPDAAADEWARKGGFIHKPAHGWLHPDARVLGPGVSYIVRVSAPGDPRVCPQSWGLGLSHFLSGIPDTKSQGVRSPPVFFFSPLGTPHLQPVLRGCPHPEALGSVPTASRGEGRGEGGRLGGARMRRLSIPYCCWMVESRGGPGWEVLTSEPHEKLRRR
jgi:hypothetical protein